MSREKITTHLKKNNKILISDGAWGTYLQKKGLKPGSCPELWCMERPEDVRQIAKSYIDAGADMVGTNSFGGTKFKLEHYGLSEKVGAINEAAARLSREAAGEEKWVAASIGPTGKMLIMGDVTKEDLYNAFKEQAVAFEKGDADAVCIETMSDIDEAVLAIKAVKENTKLEVICTFTFEKTIQGEFRTMMGVSPIEAAQAAIGAGADIIGSNCGNGLEGMVQIVKEMRSEFPNVPILVHSNAGLPTMCNGIDVFPENPDQMAALIPDIIKAGANIIGGCCGTTPEHINAMKMAANRL